MSELASRRETKRAVAVGLLLACLAVAGYLVSHWLRLPSFIETWVIRHRYMHVDDAIIALASMSIAAGAVLFYQWRRAKRQYARAMRIDPTLAENAKDLGLLNKINHAVNSGAGSDDILVLAAEEIGAAFKCPGAGIYLLSEDGRHLRVQRASFAGPMVRRGERVARARLPDTLIPLGSDGRLQEVITRCTPACVEDPRAMVETMQEFTQVSSQRRAVPAMVAALHIKSLMLIPVRSGARTLGLLAMARAGSFTSRDEQRLAIITEELAAALDRKRLEDEFRSSREAARMRADDTDFINKLNHALNEGESLHQIVVRFSQQARRIFYAKEALVLLLDEEGRSLEVQADTINPDSVRTLDTVFHIKIPSLHNPLPADSHYWNVLREGRPIVVNDKAVIDKSIGEFELSPLLRKIVPPAIDMLGLHSLLTIPLLAGGDVIGVADLFRDAPFSAGDAERFEHILEGLTVALGRKKMEEALERSEERFRRLSLIDELTELYNRRGFTALADHQLILSEREGTSLALVYCDVDGLKQINDELGHDVGDEVLIETASLLATTFRESDIISRLGGDEFAVLVVDVEDASAEVATERLARAVMAANDKEGRPYQLAISTGVAHWSPEDALPLSALLGEADRLMYAQKSRQERKSRRKIA